MKEKTTLEQTVPQRATARENRNRATVLFGEILADVFPERSVLGGAPFNVARHLAAFGQRPVLISRLGDDALGAEVLNAMKEWDMETSGVQIGAEQPTGRVQVHIGDAGHRFEILPRQAYDFIDPANARAMAAAAAPGMIYFGTLSQRHPVSRQALAAVLQNTTAPRFLDINLREPWYDEGTVRFSLQNAHIVKLSDEEFRILAGMFKISATSPQDQAGELMRRFTIDRLIVTCGGEGAWQLDGNGDVSSAAHGNESLSIVDTVGAGDAFSAACILGMTLSWPVTIALERATAFAAAICEIRGAVPEHREFYQPFFKEWRL